jgi:hypothetical protein
LLSGFVKSSKKTHPQSQPEDVPRRGNSPLAPDPSSSLAQSAQTYEIPDRQPLTNMQAQSTGAHTRGEATESLKFRWLPRKAFCISCTEPEKIRLALPGGLKDPEICTLMPYLQVPYPPYPKHKCGVFQ